MITGSAGMRRPKAVSTSCRAAARGEAARKSRQGTLSGGIEQAFGFESGLELEKSLVQPAGAGATDGLGTQLEFPTGLVQRGQGANLDMVAIGRHEVGVLVSSAEHHAAHLGARVLEGKVPVAGRGGGEIGNFAFHPQQGQG
jgi:hypothetical protein